MLMSPLRLVHSFKTGLNSVVCSFHKTCERLNQSAMVEGGQKIIDGKTISYMRAGKGPHVVLCLPGALGSAWTDFKPQLEELDKSKFSIVAWDPPGYGYSRPPDRDFSGNFFHRDAEMALKLMKLLKLPRFSMLGWSDGGITAMILAAKYPYHVHKCVVWGANSYVTVEERELYEKLRNIDSWSEKMRAPMISMYGEEYFRKMWSEWVDALILIADSGGNICEEEVKRISCPFLIVHGAKDPMISSEHPKFLSNHIFTSRIYIFPDGKHNVHLKYSKEFNKLVTDFLLKHSEVGVHAPPIHSPM